MRPKVPGRCNRVRTTLGGEFTTRPEGLQFSRQSLLNGVQIALLSAKRVVTWWWTAAVELAEAAYWKSHKVDVYSRRV